MMNRWTAGIALAATLAFGASVLAAELRFSERDAALVRDYYGESTHAKGKHKKEKGMPPGLQKKLDRDGSLPPGLQKRLDRGEALPPGLAKRTLPADLERRMPKLPVGYTRYVVGPDLVLVDTRRDIVIDIIVNVVP